MPCQFGNRGVAEPHADSPKVPFVMHVDADVCVMNGRVSPMLHGRCWLRRSAFIIMFDFAA